MPLTPYSGVFDAPQLRHLLRRTLFGFSKADIQAFAGLSLSDCVDILLGVSVAPTTPSPPVNEYQTLTADPNIPLGSTWVNGPHDGNVNFRRQDSMRGWWMGRMIHQERNIIEKMVMFLHNLVPTEFDVVDNAIYYYQYNALMRQYALGNYKTFIRAITTNPAMLVYLNGRYNQKTAPDENYARELQELFTVGKDLASHYTEDDVKAAAKILTGWRERSSTLDSYFTESRHDTTNKTFSSFYNNQVITGRTGATGGQTEIDDLLNMIFAHEEVAKYICRKLYRFFVSYNISATIETNVIVPLAETFRNNSYELLPVLSELLNSEHFFDINNVGSMIKSPVEFVMAFPRQFNIVFPAQTDYLNLYKAWRWYYSEAGKQQQSPSDPPSVAGWPAYYQVPIFHRSWINSEVLRRRKEFGDTLFYRNGANTKVDVIAFTQTLANPSDPNALIDEVLELFHPILPDASVRTSLKAILLSNQTTDSYWTTAWTNYIGAPTNTTFANTVKTRLQSFYSTVVNMAEFYLH